MKSLENGNRKELLKRADGKKMIFSARIFCTFLNGFKRFQKPVKTARYLAEAAVHMSVIRLKLVFPLKN